MLFSESGAAGGAKDPVEAEGRVLEGGRQAICVLRELRGLQKHELNNQPESGAGDVVDGSAGCGDEDVALGSGIGPILLEIWIWRWSIDSRVRSIELKHEQRATEDKSKQAVSEG
jgi:hypothetical protein